MAPGTSPNQPRTSSRPGSRSRAARSDQIFDRVRTGLETAEDIANEAERVATQVGRAARVARVVEADIEKAYDGGDDVPDGSRTRERAQGTGYDGETTEPETDREARIGLIRPAQSVVVPYQSARSSARQRKKRDPRKSDSLTALASEFEGEVGRVQERVDDLADAVELIALQRERLTGLPYRLPKHLKRRPRKPPRSRTVEVDESVKFAGLVANVKKELRRAYQDVSAFQPRLKSLLAARTAAASSASGSADLVHVQKTYDTLTQSYASVLDFVEDRANDEKRMRKDGSGEQILLDRMQEDHPGWDRAKVMAQLQRAKKAALGTSLAKVDHSSDPYTARWLCQQPFTTLDEVLQEIDLAENGVPRRRDDETGSWTLGSLLSQAFSSMPKAHADSPSGRVNQGSRKRLLTEHEVGKPHRYRSEPKPALDSGGLEFINEPDGWVDIEKRGVGPPPLQTEKVRATASKKEVPPAGSGGDDSDDSLDVSKVPERVPTDDPSGYVESDDELIADAKAQKRTEHFWTPIVIVYWICIALLYLYYTLARLLGYDSPLGNVDLGSHFGNDAWNDTSDGLVYTNLTGSSLGTSAIGSSTLAVSSISAASTELVSTTSASEAFVGASSLEAIIASQTDATTAGVTALATLSS